MESLKLKDGTDWPLNTAYNGDCLEFMKNMPDKCIDLVLTDPPYGIGEDGKKNDSRGRLAKVTSFKHKKWDREIPNEEIFSEIFRISKNQIIWGGNYFIEHLKNTSSMLVWDKDNGSSDFADCELAWTSHKKAVRMIKHKWAGMLQENMKNKEVRIHPTQKPARLFKWCLEKYAPENALVFDPFLGSFTTAVACHHYGLNWMGCEKGEDYFKDGTERYAREKQQGLFDFGD